MPKKLTDIQRYLLKLKAQNLIELERVRLNLTDIEQQELAQLVAFACSDEERDEAEVKYLSSKLDVNKFPYVK